ncbi:hypothetical protein AbraIFM66951_006681 [Aspergillus brasiliensis]|uniref:Uncharacterized protein n=1 Tax=Aspergillus brasiliensis TaxID=319629 RepID=A0A9W6DM02_9EURO|nr:hypothetical protein AbraCBS73388_007394 [Aspergillus brasiliensis]GKZ44477.1 hypothetical protein AbraIFM66951_006681 [Aspergillus brasiliensis]
MSSIVVINGADAITPTTQEGAGAYTDLAGSNVSSQHPMVAGIWDLADLDEPTPEFEAEWDEMKYVIAGEQLLMRTTIVAPLLTVDDRRIDFEEWSDGGSQQLESRKYALDTHRLENVHSQVQGSAGCVCGTAISKGGVHVELREADRFV